MGAMFIQTPNGAERVGGGGGGVNVTASVGQTIVVKEVDANGKPTKWEAADYQPRTHWSEETVVLEETTLSVESDGMFLAAMIPSVGATCKIKYNGTEYTCTAFDGSATAGFESVLFGNVDLAMGTGDTGEPFFVLIGSPAGEIAGQVVPLDGAETVTLSIKSETVTKMPFKYIPNEVLAYAPVYVDCYPGETDANPAISMTVSALERLIDAGRTVIMKVPTANSGTLYMQFAQDRAAADGKRYLGFAAGGMALLLTPQDDDSYIGEMGPI